MAMRRHPLYTFFITIALVIGVIVLFLIAMYSVTQDRWLAIDDFVEYWAAGRLNLSGGNPYNPDELLPLQHQAGRFFEVPVMMWNPPWMLAIAMPFGAMNYVIGRSIWLLFSIAFTLISSDVTWCLFNGSKQSRWLSWLIGFSFLPTLDCLRTGQTGIFLFIGVVGFLYFQRRRMDWLAGASLALLAIKPHVLYLLAIAVFFWCIQQRRWFVLTGSVFVLAIATIASVIINPLVIHQYLHAISNYPPNDWATPTLGNILRLLIQPEYFWIQFIPMVIGFVWLSYYWLKHRITWNWLTTMPLIILVSILTSAYGWTSDQTVALVAIIAVITRIYFYGFNWAACFVIIGYLIIDGIDLAMRVNQFWLWWLAPSILIWYLISNHFVPLIPMITIEDTGKTRT